MSFLLCCTLCFFIDHAESNKALLALIEENELNLRGQFGLLLVHAREKLEAKVSSRNFRTYLGALRPAPSITNVSKVCEMFDTMTKNGHWDYLHYRTLKKLLEDWKINDKKTKKKLVDYQQSLESYTLATKLIHWMEHRNKKEELPPHDHSKITIEIHPHEFTDKKLQYLRYLWERVAEEALRLPNLDAVLHDIKRKCISITWLIPASDEIEKWIRKRVPLCQDFFKKHNIVLFMLNDECIYKVQIFVHVHVCYWEKRECIYSEGSAELGLSLSRCSGYSYGSKYLRCHLGCI